MDNNKINVDVLEKNYNDFHYERTIFESVTYDTFKTSYFRSCDDELVEQMATKLNDCYSAIERNYNSTVEWWKNYLYDVKCAENGICMDSNTIPTHESSINSYFTSNLQPLPKFDKNRYSMASISSNNTASSNVSFSGGLGGTAISAKNPTNNNSNKTLDKSMLNTKILTKDELKQQYSNYYNEAKQMLVGTEYENIDDETLTKVMPAYAMYVKNKPQLEKEGYTMKGLLKSAINQQIQGEDTVSIAKELLSDLNLSAGEWFGKVLSDTGAQAVATTTSAAMSFTEGVIDLGESLGDFTISRVTSMWTNGNNFRGDLFSTAKHFVKTGDFKQLGIDMTHNGSEFVRSIDFFGLSDLAYSLAKKTSVGKYIDENSTKNEKVHNNSGKVTGVAKNIVAKDYTKSFFDSVYEKTAFGKWVKDNSLGFDTVRTVGNMTGKVAGIIAISVLIPGGGAIVRPLLAGMSGYGEGVQESFANGSSFEDGLAYGFSKGSFEGIQWFIGEKIGGSSIFKNKAANSLFRIAMDGADSAADSIINPLLDMNKEYTDEQKEQILMLVNYDKSGNKISDKTWEELSSQEKYQALFEYNGGVHGLVVNTLMGAGMSAFGEATDLAKKVDGTTKTNTDINIRKNVDGEVVNTDSLIQSKLNRYKELSDIINSDDYKQYMDYTKKGYAQKLNASYDGIEKEFKSLQSDLNLLNISKSGGFNMNDLSYKSSSSSDYTKDYLKSNLKKYVYNDTNNFNGLNDSIKMNGLYHFTTEDAADAIIDSGVIKSSDMLSSYGNKKTFFFNGIPEVGAFATNIDDIPLKTTAVKVNPNMSALESSKLKIRNLDDHAISWDGKFDLSNSSKTTKEYFCLVKENDRLVYKSVSKDVYDNYDTSDMAKSLKELLSNKKNVNTIKADYLSKLSKNNTEALSKIKNKIGNNTVDKIKANTDKLIEKNNVRRVNTKSSISDSLEKFDNAIRLKDDNDINSFFGTHREFNDPRYTFTYSELNEREGYVRVTGPVIGAYLRDSDVDFCTKNGERRIYHADKESLKGYLEQIHGLGYYMDKNDYKSIVESMDNMIKKSSPLQEDTILYRGVNNLFFKGEKLNINSIKVGDLIDDKAFTSTSVIKDACYDQNNIVLEILAPKGTKGTYLGRNAKEWLLSRNTTLKILSKPEVVNGKIVIKAEIYSQTPIEKIKNVFNKSSRQSDVSRNMDLSVNKNLTQQQNVVRDMDLSNNKHLTSKSNYNNLFNKLNDGVDVDNFVDYMEKKGLMANYEDKIIDIDNLYRRGSKIAEHDVSHVERVMLYSMYMGDKLNLSEHNMDLLVQASKYHDVGVYAGHSGHSYVSANEVVENLKGKYSTSDVNKIAAIIEYHEVDELGRKFDDLLAKSNMSISHDLSLNDFRKNLSDNNKNELDKVISKISGIVDISDMSTVDFKNIIASEDFQNFDNICRKYSIPMDDIMDVKKIADILKDADAIDRTRFIDNLNVNYFRNKDLANSLVKTSYQMQEIRGKVELDKILAEGTSLDKIQKINLYRNKGVPDYLIDFAIKYKSGNINNFIEQHMRRN